MGAVWYALCVFGEGEGMEMVGTVVVCLYRGRMLVGGLRGDMRREGLGRRVRRGRGMGRRSWGVSRFAECCGEIC